MPQPWHQLVFYSFFFFFNLLDQMAAFPFLLVISLFIWSLICSVSGVSLLLHNWEKWERVSGSKQPNPVPEPSEDIPLSHRLLLPTLWEQSLALHGNSHHALTRFQKRPSYCNQWFLTSPKTMTRDCAAPDSRSPFKRIFVSSVVAQCHGPLPSLK